jgi:hypothetical protein
VLPVILRLVTREVAAPVRSLSSAA